MSSLKSSGLIKFYISENVILSNPAPIPHYIKPLLILLAIIETASKPLLHYLFTVHRGVFKSKPDIN